MGNLHLYTTAELGLMVIRHKEGRVTFPAKMLKSIKAEIANRNLAKIEDEHFRGC